MGRDLTPTEREEYEKSRMESLIKTAALLGISTDELLKIEEKAKREVYKDTDWEKQLNERNKKRAGIIVEHNLFEPKRKTASGDDPYAIEREALELIQVLKTGYDGAVENEILRMFDNIKECLSPYRHSINYKSLGDALAELGMKERAIATYEIGLYLNPKLPVKKKISQLKKDIIL